MNPRSRRATRTIEFAPPAVDAVADALRGLREAGSGWINLLPGIDEDAAVPQPGAGIFAVFGGRNPPVSMATVMPPARDRRGTEGITVGLMHPTGGGAVARLADAGVVAPSGWRVHQDHPRRGLLVRTSPEADDADVVRWAVEAGAALCQAPTTGSWRAVVYLP